MINAFFPERISRCLQSLREIEAGHKYDLTIIHNAIEPVNITNRIVRSNEQILSVDRLIDSDLKLTECNKKQVLRRENIGEDLGSFRYYHATQNWESYPIIFFVNEITVFKPGWLKKTVDYIKIYPRVGAFSPQVCKGINFPLCLKSTYWGGTRGFLKHLLWPEPLSRSDAELQEMELVYPQAKKLGYDVAQIGNGFNLMNYTYPDGSIYTNITHKDPNKDIWIF